MDDALTYRRGEDRNGNHAVVYQYAYHPDGSLKEAKGGGISYQYEYTKNGRLSKKSANGAMILA